MGNCRNWLVTSSVACTAVLVASCAEPIAPAGHTADVAPVTNIVAEATLLECPADTTISAQKTIGMLGGTVSAGGTSIVIPAGAVLVPQTFEVTVPASRYMEVDITAIGSSRYQFLLPVSVQVDYSRCEGNPAIEEPLSAYYIESITKSLLELMAGSDDKATRTYTFVTDHLSGYAIAN